LEEARAECEAVLGARTKLLGAEHPDTLITRDDLADVLQDLGRFYEILRASTE